MKLLGLGFKLRQAGERADASPQRTELRAEVLKMVALLRESKGGGVSAEFAKQLKLLDDNRDSIQKGLIAWIQLVEVLVQEAERSRRKSGEGARKRSQVKAALFKILTSDKAHLPGIPKYLYPLVMDVAVEWVIDGIVRAENGYALWNSRRADDESSYMVDFAGWLKQVLASVWEPAIGFLLTTYTTIKYREPLNPEVLKAVEGVETAGILADKNRALHSSVEFLKFLGEHGEQAIAGINLIFEAVHQAETFLSLDGPGKKQYAHDLIVATLEDLGFPVGSGLFGVLADVFIDAGIESAWSIFNIRAPETFKHRSATGAAGAAGGS